MASKKASNVTRGRTSPFLHREAPGATEARKGEGGFKNAAIKGRSHHETMESHPRHRKGY